MAPIRDMIRNEAGIAAAISVLKQRFAGRLDTGRAICEQHGHTMTYLRNQPPDAVIFVYTTEEVQEIVRVCQIHDVPIIPFGTGTSLEGHINAPAGGISVDFSRMDRILAVHAEDMDVVVQPGVTRVALNTHLRDTGLFFPVDPGADASLGGMAATNASGTNAVRYGVMKDNVLSIKAVLASGEIVTTAARSRKTSAGYDLTRLMVGSEGTLGLITEMTLKLHGIPEGISAATCAFPSVEDACATVIETIQMGLPVARIELMDALQVEAVNKYSGMDLPEEPTLFLEFHGSHTSVREQTQQFRDIAEGYGASAYRFATKEEDRNSLWAARHTAYLAALNLRPAAQGLSTDCCVPISRLAECVTAAQAKTKELGLLAPIVGHVGDGNFHTLPLFDRSNPEEVARVETYLTWLAELAISMGGTCTGEHGIGQGKSDFLIQELGRPAVTAMAGIKAALDPHNILNPGKVIPHDA